MPDELACKLNKSKSLLVIDCRSAFAFDTKHIQGAVSVSCGGVCKRRLQQGKVSLIDLVTSKEGRNMYKKKSNKDIIIYDDQTTDTRENPKDTTLNVVINTLFREGKDPFVLKGGLKAFCSRHSDLCCSTKKHDSIHPLMSPIRSISQPAIDTIIASEVLPFVFLGNERDAANLERLQYHNIRHVLNVTSQVPLYYEKQGIKYRRIPASDSSQQNLKQYFEEAIEFIDDARQNKRRVLIHCQAGVSRSATITIAYILKHTKMTMTDVYKFVKGKRPIISPNFNFMGQLMEYERDLNSGEALRILQPRLQGIESIV
ncbi:hypothetical protein LOTGIDRAFT_154978 [Lottia gigantea]|uniref:protein-tyrosine-phosphatase n=1 Tax=Lottia gigantea TaxID=225164 RepID=V3Z499_LOTGI|nr:hypothetical protein LOTGIDRAFT_154978 [Lottia gigantea]ESO85488.1 hypothetical protein LOTGIDRAFT_154978 [Lottia gigantea]